MVGASPSSPDGGIPSSPDGGGVPPSNPNRRGGTPIQSKREVAQGNPPPCKPGGGTPISQMGVPPIREKDGDYHPPHTRKDEGTPLAECEQTENITFLHPLDAGGKNLRYLANYVPF